MRGVGGTINAVSAGPRNSAVLRHATAKCSCRGCPDSLPRNAMTAKHTNLPIRCSALSSLINASFLVSQIRKKFRHRTPKLWAHLGAKSRALRKVSGGGARVAMAVAISGPMPGTVIRRRANSSSLARRAISVSSLPTSASNCVSAATRTLSVGTASEGRSHSVSSMIAINFAALAAPCGTTCQNSLKCPRSALMAWVRCRIRSSRTRNTIAAPCVSSLFTGTTRWAQCGLTDSLGIGRIVFLAFHEGFHVGGRDEPHLMSKIANFPAPEMGTTTGFHRKDAGR